MLSDKCRFFVYGTGGAGKTMMLKFLLLSCIGNPSGLIPIFLEFRNLDLQGHETLEAAAYAQVAAEGSKEDFDLFIAGLEEGVFIVFLDGLDEIGRDLRDSVIKSVNQFSSKFNNVALVLSSRPGFSPQNLESFSAYHVCGLSLEQAVEVVQKTQADEELKREFIAQMESGLFEKHRTFLEIPLLVVMMLLTFSSYADIPDRMTVFYEQAFETLYALHDTTSKGPFKRKHYAELSPDVFRKMFEAFCYISLSKGKIDFIYSELINFITKALQVSQISADPYLVQKDLEESVCLVQQDGIKYLFVHRSFQEYFAAKFALRYGGGNQFEILSKCIGDDWQNNTLHMLNEIDEIKFREKWTLPALSELYNLLMKAAKLPLEKRLALMIGGFHISARDLQENGREIYPGAFLLAQKSRIRDLSVTLSRQLKIDSVYTATGRVRLLPHGLERDQLISSLQVVPEELLNLIDLANLSQELKTGELESDRADFEENLTNEEKYSVVTVSKENSNWFEKVGMTIALDNHLKAIREELDNIKQLVSNQKKLELEIL